MSHENMERKFGSRAWLVLPTPARGRLSVSAIAPGAVDVLFPPRVRKNLSLG